jgi:hypothetical protein
MYAYSNVGKQRFGDAVLLYLTPAMYTMLKAEVQIKERSWTS